ncbi:MAG: DUF1501 domain-containing protein [Tabrizicola sp.]|uniref:DUF1501 domain-containing protein n=1 Tax=Tabrizicola sp. TaxID=2005166 RepID=UPI0027338FE4|nr:DUF1501 domain-containing protein [Tabrizicola sp.]MDP3263341.1 DUF1501 domain-containing protein [Tabrizicola sp.]MDP3646698.1 DUF1501 domain-containing protein [Paracoccaceae bacterium]MDZ4067524.1 DUF1501 domain-containing protein [Tabrizicola sp.]
MPREPVLVVVFLRGGVDGLALVSPTSDPDLIAARPPSLRVQREGDGAGRVIAQEVADVDFRFHPNAGALADLYDAGDLTLIHAAGLSEATRSHFDAEIRIERGLFGPGVVPGDPSGWIGRWLQAAAPAGPMAALAVGASAPTSLVGGRAAVAENLTDLVLAGGRGLAPALRARLLAGFGDHGPLAQPISDLVGLSDMVSGRLWSQADGAMRPYTPSVAYPENNRLSQPLMTVAQSIKTGFGLRVATVDVPGWDTHADQAVALQGLTQRLCDALMAFWRDLGSAQQDVSVVVMSEFGRRLRSNTAGGTDHGRGNVMMVLGPQARGGRMIGRWPGLANEALDEGADLAVVTDYRSVLAELLTGHMGMADTSAVFPRFAAQPLGLWG